MSSDLVSVFLLSLVAMFNPTLLAAVTVMLLMPNPKRLMAGYLLGAYTTSITAGLLIVHSLHGTGTESAAKRPGNPIEDLVLALLCLAIAWILQTGRDRGFQARRQAKKEAKQRARLEAGKPTESLPLRLLGRGDPKLTFVVGALLSFPGVAYLDALDHIHKLNPGTAATVALIVFFCLMQQLLLELPLTGYVFAPERTQQAVTNFRGWMERSGRGAAMIGALVIGLLLLTRGIVTIA
jgi:hypothetical protein